MLFILWTVPAAFSADFKLIRNSLCSSHRRRTIFKLWPESLSLERACERCLGIFCRRQEGRVGLVAHFKLTHQPVWLRMGTPKWVWNVLMTLLETSASCGWIWSRSLHSRMVCSRRNGSKSLVLILERLMIAETCTLAPGISWGAIRSQMSNSLFCVPALNQPHWSCSARHCWWSKSCSRSTGPSRAGTQACVIGSDKLKQAEITVRMLLLLALQQKMRAAAWRQPKAGLKQAPFYAWQYSCSRLSDK